MQRGERLLLIGLEDSQKKCSGNWRVNGLAPATRGILQNCAYGIVVMLETTAVARMIVSALSYLCLSMSEVYITGKKPLSVSQKGESRRIISGTTLSLTDTLLAKKIKSVRTMMANTMFDSQVARHHPLPVQHRQAATSNLSLCAISCKEHRIRI